MARPELSMVTWQKEDTRAQQPESLPLAGRFDAALAPSLAQLPPSSLPHVVSRKGKDATIGCSVPPAHDKVRLVDYPPSKVHAGVRRSKARFEG